MGPNTRSEKRRSMKGNSRSSRQLHETPWPSIVERRLISARAGMLVLFGVGRKLAGFARS